MTVERRQKLRRKSDETSDKILGMGQAVFVTLALQFILLAFYVGISYNRLNNIEDKVNRLDQKVEEISNPLFNPLSRVQTGRPKQQPELPE